MTIEWFFWGYSLTFSSTGSAFIGDLQNFGLINVLGQPSQASSKIPALLFALYQSMFAALTPVIAVAGISERARLGPVMIVSWCWSAIVYCPIATWTWAPNGWGFQHGVLGTCLQTHPGPSFSGF